MANKITLDFETGIITFDTDQQHSVHQDPDLASKEAAILAAMGYGKIDLSGAVNAINAYVNGQIDEAAFQKAMDAEAASDTPVFDKTYCPHQDYGRLPDLAEKARVRGSLCPDYPDGCDACRDDEE